MLILKLIAAYLALAVDPPDDPDPPAAGAEDDPDPSAIENLDLDGEDPPDDPDARGAGGEGDDPDAPLRAATARAEKAEREARENADRAAAAERQARQPPPGPSQEQQLYEHEEARLRAADVTANERWQIESNRTLRANQRMAQEAMFSAQDTADRTDFNTLLTSMPLAKKYTKRIEEKHAEFKAKGQLVPRRTIFKLLIGDDIVEGKVKTGKKPKAAGAEGEAPAARTVARGTSAGIRSDVRRGAPTERDKRRARLENQQI